MTRTVPDLLPGTPDLLILRTLPTTPRHGWAISERIQQLSENVLHINQGSLYPALHRLEHHGWIESEWAVSELGRRANSYRLTAAGRGSSPSRRAIGRVCLGGDRPCPETGLTP